VEPEIEHFKWHALGRFSPLHAGVQKSGGEGPQSNLFKGRPALLSWISTRTDLSLDRFLQIFRTPKRHSTLKASAQARPTGGRTCPLLMLVRVFC